MGEIGVHNFRVLALQIIALFLYACGVFLLKVSFSFKHTFVLVTYIRYLACLHSTMNLLQG